MVSSVFARKKARIFHTVWVLQGQELEFFEIHFETQCILRNFELNSLIFDTNLN